MESLKVHFKKQLMIAGTVFKIGPHEVSETIMNHPHFANYVKWGDIVDPDQVEAKGEKKETPHELRVKASLEVAAKDRESKAEPAAVKTKSKK